MRNTRAALSIAFGLLLSSLSARAQISGGQKVVQDDPTAFATATSWVDLPGMTTTVSMTGGGELAVSFSMEASVVEELRSPILRVRLLVDRQPVPGDIVFTRSPTLANNTIHFAASGLTPGQHEIRLQWRTTIVDPAFGTATSSGRTMTARWAATTTPHIRIASAHVPASATGNGAYTPLNGLSATIGTPIQFYRPRLLIMVSGEFVETTAAGRVFARAVVNGTPTKDVVLASGTDYELDSFSFTVEPTTPPPYAVQIEWMGDNSPACRNVTLAVAAISQADNQETAYFDQSPPSGPSIPHTLNSWIPVPGANGGSIDLPTPSDIEVRFSAETTSVPGAMPFLRCKFDGVEVSAPGSVPFGAPAVAPPIVILSREVAFVIPNVPAGPHTVELEWSSVGGTTWMGDRTLAVSAITGRNACGSQISLASASTVNNVTNTSVNLAVSQANTIVAVSLGGVVVTQTAPVNPAKGWLAAKTSAIRVYLPPGLPPGPFMIRVHFPDCTSNAIPIQMAISPSVVLQTPSKKPTGAPQDFTVSRGPASPGSTAWILVSLFGTPSVIPNVLTLGIGNNFEHLLVLFGPLGFQSLTAATNARLPTSAAFIGFTLHYQALVSDGTSLLPSNVRSTLYQ